MKANLLLCFPVAVATILSAVGIASATFGQSADDGFNANVNGGVQAVVFQNDGRILLGGSFTSVRGIPRTNLARLNVDGTVDPTFAPQTDREVNSLAVQADGKILVGGSFKMLNRQPRQLLGRLELDGRLDETFNPGASSNTDIMGAVFSFAVQPDGMIWVGGYFHTLAGVPRTHLGRLHPDGRIDPGFNPSPNSYSRSIVLLPDGSILLGGHFNMLGGQPRAFLVKLLPDGRPDNSFRPAFDLPVESVARQPDGKLVVGGYFFSIGGQARYFLGRLQPDGALDPSFNTAANNIVYSLAVQPDGKIVVGGLFTMLGGQTRRGLGRLHPDGSLDHGFKPITTNVVYGLAVQPDGKILAGGTWTFSRHYPDGSTDATLNAGASDESCPSCASVSSLAIQADGKILAGGSFTSLGGAARTRLGRLNPDGTLDTNFNPWIDNVVSSLAVQRDGKILVGGFFQSLGGVPAGGLGRLYADGTRDPDFKAQADAAVFSLAIQPDGRILAGGQFTRMNDQPAMIARLNSDGTLDNTTWSGGIVPGGASVFTLAPQPDGKIVMGGYFTMQVGEQIFTNLCRWNTNGTLDHAFNPGIAGPDYPDVTCLTLQPDGKILVAGHFTTLAGQSQTNIGRLNPDGSPDTFNAWTDDRVLSLALQADGRILLGGLFTNLNGTNCNHLARLNADGSLDTSFTAGADDFVRSLAVQPDGKILAGGNFSMLGGQQRDRIGRLTAGLPARQTLHVEADGTSLTWSRSGSAPEVHQVTFELSDNSAIYTALGSGTRVTGGWQLAGLSLLAGRNYFIRARGYTTGGQYSEGLIESVTQIWLPWPPHISTVRVLGNGPLRLTFTETNAVGFTVLASTNVSLPSSSWTVLGSPTPLGAGAYEFSDPAATNLARRFYQLRSR